MTTRGPISRSDAPDPWRVVVFETARRGGGVVLAEWADPDDPHASASRLAGQMLDPEGRHGRELIPALGRLMADWGWTPRDLRAVAVGRGPGSFTGLRVGLAAAKTLAFTFNLPLIGFDSLDPLVPLDHDALRPGDHVSVALDALRGEAFVAEFVMSRQGQPIRCRDSALVSWSSWLAQRPPDSHLISPDLERLLKLALPPDHLNLRVHPASLGLPDATRLAWVARRAWLAGSRLDPDFSEPVYLRPSAAEERHPGGLAHLNVGSHRLELSPTTHKDRA
ncbi:peptidase M22 glycoprotease [Isosphaera pallida ATCC 43644]|uniref:Peptidase M22 glycoprotease n=1 Tax=Isosphaera pallida (strain ATCC 43644 / DSM 9630 / IS1B) TaxID=575540 RepID=E8QZ36_ISOPI|nr:tRNA (adenosine(37)-N6)-threonylcarbamoyltransferase complex dimerization subunit type 1 TsaB [Isosphaera pallida]ADV63178.1 peptidase M22 glycoprotease [Isosphaera pallida ATCC 43644]